MLQIGVFFFFFLYRLFLLDIDQRMEVERGRERIGHVNRVGYMKKVIKKRKHTRKIKQVEKVVPVALQDLFVSCQDVFKGPGTVPAPQDVHKLCTIIGTYVLNVPHRFPFLLR